MATTPKLNLTDVPFVTDEAVKPGDFGIASKESVPILTKEARAIVAAKDGFDERKTALDQAAQSLASFCKSLAAHVIAMRKQFVNSAGAVDWKGTSNAYKRFVTLNVYEPMFGTRPEGVDRNKWLRESGTGTFQTTLNRALSEYVDEAAAQAQLESLDPTDERFVPVNALRSPEQAAGSESDSQLLVKAAREAKVTRIADGPDVNRLMDTIATALGMMVRYGDPENPSLAPGLLKLTPNESIIWQTRLVRISADIRTVARIVEAKIADATAAAETDEVEGETEPVEQTA